MFDIDGVFVRGKEVFSHSAEALKLLVDRKGRFKVPTVFVTNAGNTLRSHKAANLSERLGIKVSILIVQVCHRVTESASSSYTLSEQGPVSRMFTV